MTNIGASNRLLRQYLHKNADLGSFTQDELDSVAAKLNHRPRRVLGWITPAEAFDRVKHTGGRLSNSNVLSSAVVTSLIAAGRFGRVA